jgi:hypothetical protein
MVALLALMIASTRGFSGSFKYDTAPAAEEIHVSNFFRLQPASPVAILVTSP